MARHGRARPGQCRLGVQCLRHAGRRLPYGRTALTSFASYVASHNLGLSGLGGTAVRYRLYTAFGLSAGEIAEVVAFCGLTEEQARYLESWDEGT